MKIDKINPQTTCFKSKFIPNEMLEQTFKRAAKENDRFFVKSVRALLNDGKADTFHLQRNGKSEVSLCVNNELADTANYNYYGNAGTELINKYVSKTMQESMCSEKYNYLSEREKNAVAEDVDLIKLLSENFESGKNYIEEVQQIIKNMKQKIDNNTKQELEELKKVIFGK